MAKIKKPSGLGRGLDDILNDNIPPVPKKLTVKSDEAPKETKKDTDIIGKSVASSGKNTRNHADISAASDTVLRSDVIKETETAPSKVRVIAKKSVNGEKNDVGNKNSEEKGEYKRHGKISRRTWS